MKFCSHCAQQLSFKVPEGDNLPRHVCDSCGMIHYQNPKIVAGCIPEWEGRILLCRRAIEPRHGLWTIPAGFMENRETVEQAAARETREEACANINITGLYGVYNIPQPGRVHHFCIGVDDFDADRVKARFDDVGYEARVSRNPAARTSGGDQLYFTDPDGTLVQLGHNGYQG